MKYLVLLLIVFACNKNESNFSDVTHADVFKVPEGFPALKENPLNPLSKNGIYLGRVLYYDTLLSSGGPRAGNACASCHLQEYGFALPGQTVLPHCNLAWNSNFLWKGEISGSLEDIMAFEVNDFFESNMEGLRKSGKYYILFKKAFGDTSISKLRTSFAIAQFIRSLVSYQSPYDLYKSGIGDLSPSAKRGMKLFFNERGDCFHCHTDVLFSDNALHSIGLQIRKPSDMGRYLITGSSADIGKFKTPGLRNVALRTVYMHDGRFKTLKEVVEHYNTGILKSDYLDPLLDRDPPGLSSEEISDMVAFLESLTDSSFIHDKNFSSP